MGRPRTWTDDELRAALDDARTMREVVERLRLRRGGASYTTVRTRMEQLGLALPRSGSPSDDREPGPWRRTFTEAQLEAAVAASTSLHGVFQHLGIKVGGGQWLSLRALILERGWSTEHWRLPLQPSSERPAEVARFRQAIREADISALVAGSRSRADVIRALGFEPRSSLYRVLREVLREPAIPTAHFEAPHQRIVASPGRRRRRPLDELLVRGSKVGTNTLRRRLLEEGVFEHRCARCGATEWLGEPIPLQLDHIDGDRSNNVLTNLRLLCPNCHALTDTYCGRNIGRYGGRR